MSFDPSQYVLMTPMWEVFTDKDTLTFLAGGYALFFQDANRAQYNPVYMLVDTGGPYPNYTYQTYGFLNSLNQWQVDLNSQGAFDQAVYGNILNGSGNVQLYFIQFYNSQGVFQFSREAWPNIASSSTPAGSQVNYNYVQNPQFILQNNLPAVPALNLQAGQIRAPVTNVAPGGWYYERPNTSIAIDLVTYDRFGSPVVPPPAGNPRYAINVACQSPDFADTYKDLSLQFDNVTMFSSLSDVYTYAFTGQSNNGTPLTVQLYIKYNYGTGGSAPSQMLLTTFSIAVSETEYSYTFNFPELSGITIGPNDDDFIELTLRFPSSQAFNVQFTDFILQFGSATAPIFPATTVQESLYRTLPGSSPIPDYHGNTLALPVIMGQNGYTFDYSNIGKIYATLQTAPGYGELACDGSAYITVQDSTDSIPYSRLFNVLFNPITQYSMFGTGNSFVTCYVPVSPPSAMFVLSTNAPGSCAGAVDGGVPTTFTFASIHTGQNYNAIAQIGISGLFTVRTQYPTTAGFNNVFGPDFYYTPGTSGFTYFNMINNTEDQYYTSANGTTFNYDYAVNYQVGAYTATVATSLASKYMFFAANNGTMDIKYYLWWKVNGAGTDPAPAASTGIQLDLLSTYSAVDVGILSSFAISGAQMTSVVTVAASAMTAGSYFTFGTIGQSYYVWYTINGLGTNPNVIGSIGILVPILSTDTAAIVATKTQFAIHSYQYAVPDMRGVFLRGWNNLGYNDPDTALRVGTLGNNGLGSFQFSDYTDHAHQYITTGIPFPENAFGSVVPITAGVAFYAIPESGTGNASYGGNIQQNGGNESRPVNIAVNYVIKY